MSNKKLNQSSIFNISKNKMMDNKVNIFDAPKEDIPTTNNNLFNINDINNINNKEA